MTLRLKAIALATLGLLMLGAAQVNAATVKNLRAEQRGSEVILTYDLVGAPSAGAEIRFKVSTDGGRTWRFAAGVEGDVGRGVRNGSGRQIRWKVLRQYPRGLTRRVKLRVQARHRGGSPLPPRVSGGKYISPTMRSLKGACFDMGSKTSESGRSSNERRHRVCVGDFQIGKYEVTRGEFAAFVKDTGYRTDAEKNADGLSGCRIYSASAKKWQWTRGRSWRNPGYSQTDKHPVACVSWRDATAYARWISRKTGKSYRLATEAEWEYTARAGSKGKYPWGYSSSGACKYANVGDKTRLPNGNTWTKGHKCSDGYGYTGPVGRKKRNNWGVYDMIGNVWEWTCSAYYSNYDGKEKLCTTATSGTRVRRGGAFDSVPRWSRSAARFGTKVGFRAGYLGFRLASGKSSSGSRSSSRSPTRTPSRPSSSRGSSSSSTPSIRSLKGGCFLMGSLSGETGRQSNERRHRVCVKDFGIGRYEVTRGQFKAFVSATGYRTEAEKNAGGKTGCRVYSLSARKWKWTRGRSWRNPGYKQSDRDPVVCVSWKDSQAYVKWLSRKTGKRYRMATEAEHEYATRAGSRSARPWGSSTSSACRYANVADKTPIPGGTKWNNGHSCSDGYGYTGPVGRKQRNKWGLYDMIGNVWEWTCTPYYKNYDGYENKCTSATRGTRVRRGGAFDSVPRWARSAARFGTDVSFRSGYLGFRVARDKK